MADSSDIKITIHTILRQFGDEARSNSGLGDHFEEMKSCR